MKEIQEPLYVLQWRVMGCKWVVVRGFKTYDMAIKQLMARLEWCGTDELRIVVYVPDDK